MLSRLMTRKEQLLLVVLASAIFVGALVLYFHDTRPPATEFPTHVESDPEPLAALKNEVREMEPIAAQSLADTVQPTALRFPKALCVSVSGAVHAPGVYELDSEARVKDLIKEAKGETDEADLSDINLAAKLIDGSTLVIPVAAEMAKDGGKLTLRSGESAAALNPPQYTISGWQPLAPGSPTASKPKTGSGAPSSGAAQGRSGGLIDVNTASQEELDSLPGIGPVTAEKIIQYRSLTPFTCVDDLDNVSGIGPKKLEAVRPLITVR